MRLVLVLLFCIAIFSCKEAPKETKKEAEAPELAAKIDDSKYPEVLRKFLKHMGD